MTSWVKWPGGHPRFGYGADYNPDQWDREVWQEDVALMQKAGVTIVSLGIFMWARVEPENGRFDFSPYDELMDLLHAHGIAVCLATGTASPPPWLVRAHPEVLPVDAAGSVLEFGARQSWCPSSRVFMGYATRLARRVAEHYRDHPALAAWHVSNEYGCHNAHCFCPTSANEFRRWLTQRYGTVDELNRAWGTDFWSQRYASFDQVEPPPVTYHVVGEVARL